MKCPKCGANWKQYIAGFNPSGSQRYRCGECNRVYTIKPTQHGYSEETWLLAIRMYVEGSSYGSIGRVLKVNPQSVANWVSAYTADGQFWTVEDLALVVRERYGVEYQSRMSYSRLLLLCGFSYQKTEKIFKSCSEAKVADFEEQPEKN